MSIKLFGRGVFLGRAGIHGKAGKLKRVARGRGEYVEGSRQKGGVGEWGV